MNSITFFIYPGGAFIVTVLFGFWLSRQGKPYQGVLFSVHKLLALAAVVLVGLQFSNRFKSGEMFADWKILLILIALMVLILFASGALMSLDKLNYKMLRWFHRLAPIGLVGLGAWMIGLS